MNEFETLLSEINAMTKSLPAPPAGDDKRIAAAAGTGADADTDPDGDDDDDTGTGGDADGSDMAKSLTVTLEDGTKVPAIDGAPLLKALSERVDLIDQGSEGVKTTVVALVDLVKSLHAQVAKFSDAGRGRRAVVTVAERQPPANPGASEPSGITPDEFMAKCMVARDQGLITGLQVARAETYLNKGMTPPQDILQAVSRLKQ